MLISKFKIENIPAVLWGKKSNKVYIAVHGNMSNKEDTVIQILAQRAEETGYQVLSFDLPEHGDRKNASTPCKVQICVNELNKIMEYAKSKYSEINLFACSMGAYFSLLAYKDSNINKALFLSPILDMQRLIEDMMIWFNVRKEDLKREGTIETANGQKLYYDYYTYVKEHPINKWNINTSILYGAKDNLSIFDTLSEFVNRFNCDLQVLDNGEHYFHTEDQLNVFKEWINKNIVY